MVALPPSLSPVPSLTEYLVCDKHLDTAWSPQALGAELRDRLIKVCIGVFVVETKRMA